MAIFAKVEVRGVEVNMRYMELMDSFAPIDDENHNKFTKAIGLDSFSYLAYETEDGDFVINFQDLDGDFQDQIISSNYEVTEE